MIRTSTWKNSFVLIICFLGTILALPNFLSPDFQPYFPSWLPKYKVNLGLDLQGGSQLLLEVDLKTGLQERLNSIVDSIRKTLKDQKIGYIDLHASDQAVLFDLRSLGEADKAHQAILQTDGDLEVIQKDQRMRIQFSESSLKSRQKQIIDQSIKIVHMRIDESGTREPLIQPQGDDRILIQLPGIEDPKRIKNLLGRTAKMSFRLLAGENEEVSSKHASIPLGTEILSSDEKKEGGGIVYYVVHKENLLGGESLIDAGIHFDEYQRPEVSFKFDHLGANKFADITSKNIGRRLAIVLDDKVISAPRINSTIRDSGIIQGRFTLPEAQELALLMRAGALVAPLKVIEERTVGPDLGADSIEAGRHATILSIVMVAFLMMIIYSLFGLIANIAMIFNLILMVAALSFIGATLTLPGIAGIALTMGMAVDANVLINERIKDELRLGRHLHQAVDMGYNKAMATIIDSNITTIIGAAALFFFGTGPVKGFGVTLSIGILVSMFTAITLTRLIVTYWLKWIKPQHLYL